MKKKTPRVIIDRILEDIKTGKIIPGQALPSQKELCSIYKTGRSSIREAFQALELVDVLEIKPGVGVFVKNFTLDSFFNPARLNYKVDDKLIPDLLEFRALFETIVVSSAVKNATEEDIDRLNENLELTKFFIDKNNKKQYVRLDYEFHKQLSESSHNKVIDNFFNIIFPLLKFCLAEILIKTTALPGVMNDTYHAHKKIFESVKNRDEKRALHSVKEHIEFVRKNFDAISKKAESSVTVNMVSSDS